MPTQRKHAPVLATFVVFVTVLNLDQSEFANHYFLHSLDFSHTLLAEVGLYQCCDLILDKDYVKMLFIYNNASMELPEALKPPKHDSISKYHAQAVQCSVGGTALVSGI